MGTVVAVAKAIGILVAALSFFVFYVRKRAWSQSLDEASQKAQETGDTSAVEDMFRGTPPDPQ